MVVTKRRAKSKWSALPEPSGGARRVRVCDADEMGPSGWEASCGRVVGYSARGPAKATANEDALLIMETSGGAVVLAVADGLGGHTSGEKAAQLTIDAMANAVRAIGDESDQLRTAIIDGIEHANRAVIDLGNGAGATLAVAYYVKPFVRSMHVGDSAIVLMGQRGRVRHETIAHSPVGYAEASGILPAEDALSHEERHLISNYVGTEEMRIEIGPAISMARYDTLLLATDGLVDNVLPGEAVAHLRSGPLIAGAEALARLARERMNEAAPGVPSKPDDCTFLAFRRGG